MEDLIKLVSLYQKRENLTDKEYVDCGLLIHDLTEAIAEKMADKQHQVWTHWMDYFFSRCTIDSNGNAVVPKDLVERWKRQMATSYENLSESEKGSDRNVVKQFKLLPWQ